MVRAWALAPTIRAADVLTNTSRSTSPSAYLVCSPRIARTTLRISASSRLSIVRDPQVQPCSVQGFGTHLSPYLIDLRLRVPHPAQRLRTGHQAGLEQFRGRVGFRGLATCCRVGPTNPRRLHVQRQPIPHRNDVRREQFEIWSVDALLRLATRRQGAFARADRISSGWVGRASRTE